MNKIFLLKTYKINLNKFKFYEKHNYLYNTY
jgi:hypothetical protein